MASMWKDQRWGLSKDTRAVGCECGRARHSRTFARAGVLFERLSYRNFEILGEDRRQQKLLFRERSSAGPPLQPGDALEKILIHQAVEK